MIRIRIAWAVAALLFLGCGDDGTTLDAGQDAGRDGGGADARTDAQSVPDASTMLAPTTTVDYLADGADILNPERGFHGGGDLVTGRNFSYVRDEGYTLMRAYIRFDDYRDQPVPDAVLTDIGAGLDAVRAAGLKVIPRVAYNFGFADDAPKAQILEHIAQLQPIFEDYQDVIFTLQAGFIGAWGEWHASTHGLDNPTDREDILEALFAALPASRTVQVRTPNYKLDIYGEMPLSAAEAYSGTSRARLGHHNDCFLANASDAGTYTPGSTGWTVDQWKSWLADDTRYAPMGGETCQVSISENRTDCPTALAELEQLHFTYLNPSFYEPTLDRWRTEGCFDEVTRRLGYRFTLQEADVPAAVRPGGQFVLRFVLHNDGWASLTNARPLFVVLEGDSDRFEVRLADVDPRDWAAGQDAEVTVRLELPATMPAGSYRLALWLPDDATALRARPEYSVRFANDATWNVAAGTNELATVDVNDGAPGSRNDAATELTVLPPL